MNVLTVRSSSRHWACRDNPRHGLPQWLERTNQAKGPRRGSPHG
jgi:hypothetical protein